MLSLFLLATTSLSISIHIFFPFIKKISLAYIPYSRITASKAMNILIAHNFQIKLYETKQFVLERCSCLITGCLSTIWMRRMGVDIWLIVGVVLGTSFLPQAYLSTMSVRYVFSCLTSCCLSSTVTLLHTFRGESSHRDLLHKILLHNIYFDKQNEHQRGGQGQLRNLGGLAQK